MMKKNLQRESAGITVKINFLGKLMCILLTAWSNVTMIIFILFFLNFSSDSPTLLRINLHDNIFIDLCSIIDVDCESVNMIIIKIVFNIFLSITFWLQHIVMAKLSFKARVSRIFPEYLIIERPMFNLAAQLIFIVSFSLFQPIDLVLFDLIKFSYLTNIILVLGLILFTASIFKLGNGADLMGWTFLKYLMTTNNKNITFDYKYLQGQSLVSTGIYGMCRHPMQLSVIMIILSIGQIWSFSRIVYSFSLIGGILIGIAYEETRLETVNENYKAYKEQVPFSLIPNVFSLFASSKNNAEENEQEEGEKEPLEENKDKNKKNK